ncbi:MAG: type II toxin-antitoxin system PemK/MazF family toxin [Porticoccaceae bacterium]
MTDENYPRYGSVYWYSASRHSGDSKIRPGIIVSKDASNKTSDRVQIVPLSRTLEIPRNLYASRFVLPAAVSGLEFDSMAQCDRATTLLKTRIKSEVVSALPENWIEHMKKCLSMSHENKMVIVTAAMGI